MKEDNDYAYAMQEIRHMELSVDALKSKYKQGEVTAEQALDAVYDIHKMSMEGTVHILKDFFEHGEKDVVEYLKEKIKEFNEAEKEIEQCVILDIICYMLQRMDIKEIRESGIFKEN